MSKILIVDDDDDIRSMLSNVLGPEGFIPLEAAGGRQALNLVEQEHPVAVLLDMRMPEMDGIEVMRRIKSFEPDLPVIIVTGHGDVQTAVEAIKEGAYDFILKPPDFDRLLLTLRRAIEKADLQKTVDRLSTAVDSSLEWLLGKGRVIGAVIKQVHQVAWSDFSIIIQGETGTGKSTIARAIHNLSRRARGPFTTVDIGAIPEGLIESELFGHERGAFTGADRKRKGFFETASRGTLLIDELENMSAYIQSKLLRAVEERKVYPLGSTAPVEVDVRIIAATNTDIRQAVKEKHLREDLFYRLGEFIISLPPLRERIEDIPFLAHKFFKEAASELNKQGQEMAEETVEILKRYPWPGNVRELKNVMRRAVLLSGRLIKPEHLDFLIADKSDADGAITLLPLKELAAIAQRDVEEKAIRQVLELTQGNKSKAASILQVDYKTLLTKIKEYNIKQN